MVDYTTSARLKTETVNPMQSSALRQRGVRRSRTNWRPKDTRADIKTQSAPESPQIQSKKYRDWPKKRRIARIKKAGKAPLLTKLAARMIYTRIILPVCWGLFLLRFVFVYISIAAARELADSTLVQWFGEETAKGFIIWGWGLAALCGLLSVSLVFIIYKLASASLVKCLSGQKSDMKMIFFISTVIGNSLPFIQVVPWELFLARYIKKYPS